MRQVAGRVVSSGSMQQPDDAGTQLDTIRAQISQGMIEHELVMQALRMQAIVSALFVLVLGSLLFFLWKRHACLTEALHATIRQHSSERISLVKQHSLEQSSLLMQMLHAFEGIVSKRRGTSASSRVSSESATPPPLPSTTPQPPASTRDSLPSFTPVPQPPNRRPTR
jgi:hypothetical protein